MKKLAAVLIGGLALMSLLLFSVYLRAEESDTARSVINLSQETESSAADTPSPAPESSPAPASPTIIPTTIEGGMVIKNTTDYEVDIDALLDEGCSLHLGSDGPQILIIHTHSSEAYTPAGLDKYEDLGTNRTLEQDKSVIRVGTELASIFESYGLSVVHDTQVFDYPSYTGSYDRCCTAIEEYLAQYPSIKIVIDLHRDALGSDTVTYKTEATEAGVCASQAMLVIGTDASGLEHPSWEENLKLAVYLQNAVNASSPSLMRPILLTKYRYNQHLTTGSMILEVGSNGNTLQEALAAVRLFGSAAAPALAALRG